MTTPSDGGFLNTIREKTGINPLILIAGVLGALAVVFLGHSQQYITAVVGILFPSYMSLKAIETKDGDDDKQWCTYWVIFFLFELAELFFGYILHFLPFFFLIKLVVIVWLFFPTTNGATFIYEAFLSKLFSKYETHIDSTINDVKNQAREGVDKAKKLVGKS